MKTKPMLCKGPVVRAMMDGLQTQDRRPIKPQPADDISPATSIPDDGVVHGWKSSLANDYNNTSLHIPAYQVGDVIWVRETWMRCSQLDGNGNYIPDTTKTLYAATDCAPDGPDGSTPLPWKPSIHMPKQYCRIFLKVNKVRIERVTDISWQDACAEGFADYGDNPSQGHRHDPVGWFHDLWESIYPGTWKRNHWVWVYEFELTDKPANWPTN